MHRFARRRVFAVTLTVLVILSGAPALAATPPVRVAATAPRAGDAPQQAILAEPAPGDDDAPVVRAEPFIGLTWSATETHVNAPLDLTIQTMNADFQPEAHPGTVVLFLPDALARVDGYAAEPSAEGARFSIPLTDDGHAQLRVTFASAGKLQALATLSEEPDLGGVSPLVIVHDVRFAISLPDHASVGESLTATLVALDEQGAPVTDYRGEVVASVDDAGALLTDASDTPAPAPGLASHRFSPSDAGQTRFSVTFASAGTHTLTVSDVASASRSTSATSVVADPAVGDNQPLTLGNAAPLADWASQTNIGPVAMTVTPIFTVTPSVTTTNAGVSLTLTVTALDANGNTDTAYRGQVKLTSTDAAFAPGTLFGYTFTAADNGMHVFTTTFNTAGAAQTMTVTDTVTASRTGVSAAVTVAETYLVATFTSSAVMQGVADTLTVQAKDGAGALVTGFRGTLQLSSSWDNVLSGNWGGGASVFGSYTLTAADAGQHAFAPKFSYAGDETVTATHTALTSRAVTTSVVTVTNSAPGSEHHEAAPSGIELPDGSLVLAYLDVWGDLYTRHNVGSLAEPAWRPLVSAHDSIVSGGARVGANSPSLVRFGSTLALFHTFTDGTYYQIWLTTSTDDGASWSTPTQLTSESGSVAHVQAVVDGGTLYLFWSRLDTNQQLVYRTTSDLTTWSATSTVGQAIGAAVNHTTSNFGIARLASGDWLLGWLAPSVVNEMGAGNSTNYPTVHVAHAASLSSWSSATELNLPYSQRWPESVALAQEPGTNTIYAAFDEYAYSWDTYIATRTSSDGVSWATQTISGYDHSAAADGRQGYTGRTPALIAGSMLETNSTSVGGGNVQAYGSFGVCGDPGGGRLITFDDQNDPTEVPPIDYGLPPSAPDGPCAACQKTQFPINVVTGMESSSSTDLAYPALGLPLAVTRTYNSYDGVASRDSQFGVGWSWVYGARALALTDGSVSILDGDGKRLVFWWNGTTWDAAPNINATLAVTGGGFALTRHDQTVWTFDSAGQLTSIADRNGNTQTLTYTSGVLTSIAASGGRTLTITTDGNGHITAISGPGSLSASYTYDGSGHLATATDSAGATTTYTYDTRHQLLTVVDANSHTVETNVYGSLGRVKQQTDAGSNVLRFDYAQQGYLGSLGYNKLTDGRGNQVWFANDSAGRLIDQQVWLVTGGYPTTKLSEASWTYTANGDVARYTDPRGYITDYTFDTRGNLLTQIVDHVLGGLNLTTTYTYDSLNDLLTVTDPLNHTTTFTYDTHGNLLTVQNALAQTTATFTYNADGTLATATDGVSNTSSFGYATAGDLTSITEPGSVVTTLGYDTAGRLTSVTDPLSHTTTLAVNGRGQVTSVTNPLSQVTSLGYDSVGNRTSVTDALTRATTYGYDALNRLTSVTDALSQVTNYTYDGNSNLTRVTDANTHQTNYTYDAANRLKTVADALSNTTTNTYDAAGNVTQTLNANGVTNRYVYDHANRLTGVDLANNGSLDITYAYDAASRRTGVTDSTGTTTYGYDTADRLTSVTAPTTGTVSYAYNAANQRTSITYPSTHQVTYTYTTHGQLSTVTDWLSNVTTYSYDAADRLTGIASPNGVSGTLSYDTADRLTGISYAKGGTTLEAITYALNAVGVRTGMTDTSGTTTWAYDALYRLTTATYPNADVVSYGYDAVGNRTSLTVNGTVTTNTFDNADRMTGSGSDTYSYNNNGNLTSKTVGGVTTNYTYDQLNRLTALSGSVTASYTYNGANLRVAKTTGGVTTTYTWDQTGLGTVVGDGNEYVWGAGLISRVTSGSVSTYAHSDGLGSVRLLTDATGASVGTQAYAAFGATRAQSGVQLAFTYTGEQVDPESGLVYLRARYMDPATGRFLTKDPFAGYLISPVSLPRYGYVANIPTTITDPSGLCPPAVIMGSCEGGSSSSGTGSSTGGGGTSVETETIYSSAPNYDAARNQALEESGLGAESKPNVDKFNPDVDYNGRQSLDGKRGFRVEYDDKHNAHIN